MKKKYKLRLHLRWDYLEKRKQHSERFFPHHNEQDWRPFNSQRDTILTIYSRSVCHSTFKNVNLCQITIKHSDSNSFRSLLRQKIFLKLFCFNPFIVVLSDFSGPSCLLKIGRNKKKFIILVHLKEASLRGGARPEIRPVAHYYFWSFNSWSE